MMLPQTNGHLGKDTAVHASGMNGLSDVINSELGKVNIIERFPKSGMPPAGTPFSIKIEVQTYRSAGDFWRTPFACLDAFVVVRGLYQYEGKILASSFVRTDALAGCTGQATLTFDHQFRPGNTDWVQFEIYKGGTQEFFSERATLERVKAGQVEMVGKSQPMRFNASEKDLQESGVIQEQESVMASLNNSLFGNMRSTVGSVTTLVGVSLGAYLIWKNGDAIKEYVASKVDTVKPATIKKKLSG